MVVDWGVSADVVVHGVFQLFEFLVGHEVLESGVDLGVQLDLGSLLLDGVCAGVQTLFVTALLEIFLFRRTSRYYHRLCL